jgi:hypothetical protein
MMSGDDDLNELQGLDGDNMQEMHRSFDGADQY